VPASRAGPRWVDRYSGPKIVQGAVVRAWRKEVLRSVVRPGPSLIRSTARQPGSSETKANTAVAIINPRLAPLMIPPDNPRPGVGSVRCSSGQRHHIRRPATGLGSVDLWVMRLATAVASSPARLTAHDQSPVGAIAPRLTVSRQLRRVRRFRAAPVPRAHLGSIATSAGHVHAVPAQGS
jgi:hypothetical protein